MKKGITLIETIVAVTVLTMALGGPFLLAAKSLRSAAYAREEIAAARLAEEGLEAVHNMRDNNAAESDAGSGGRRWDTDITACTNGCVFDVTKQLAPGSNQSIWQNTALSACALGSCDCAVTGCTTDDAVVYQHSGTGLYIQTNNPGGLPAAYKKVAMWRVIRITPVAGLQDREYLIESSVYYRAGPQIRVITLNDTIMNWFPAMETLI